MDTDIKYRPYGLYRMMNPDMNPIQLWLIWAYTEISKAIRHRKARTLYKAMAE